MNELNTMHEVGGLMQLSLFLCTCLQDPSPYPHLNLNPMQPILVSKL